MAIISIAKGYSTEDRVLLERTIVINTDEIINIIIRRIVLFLYKFTHIAPVMLIIGRTMRSSADKCRQGFLYKGLAQWSLEYAIKANTRIKLFKNINNGIVESGFKIPKSGPSSFIKSPASIRNAMLSPTDKRRFSNQLSSYILSSLRRRKPGIKVKYKKPITCLAIGIFNRTITYTIVCRNTINSRKSLNFQLTNFRSIHKSPDLKS